MYDHAKSNKPLKFYIFLKKTSVIAWLTEIGL